MSDSERSCPPPSCVCPAWARCNLVPVLRQGFGGLAKDPCIMNQIRKQILAEGNCETVRDRGKAAYGKDMSPRTGTSYKADGAGELAQHSEALGSAPEVNDGVVCRNNAFLPGEVSCCGTGGFQTTREARAPAAAMRQAVQSGKSAEGVVVVTEPVSNRRRETRPVKDAARCGGRRPEPKKWNQPEVSDG